jgi:hypothetical protein
MMADDKNKAGKPDRDRINVNGDDELRIGRRNSASPPSG